MRNELDTYQELRKNGHSEEDALKEAKFFSKSSNGNVDDLVTGKDLKIALLEFREALNENFSKIEERFSRTDRLLLQISEKLENSTDKIKGIIWYLWISSVGFVCSLGYIITKLFEILNRLPQ